MVIVKCLYISRYQTKEEQQGLTDESVTGSNSVGEKSKVSPRLRFSTPLARHSICMELKDRVNTTFIIY